MKKFMTIVGLLTVIATPAFAQSLSMSSHGTGNVLPSANQPTAPKIEKIAVGQSGLHSFAMVPGPASAHPYDSSRVPAFDYRNGTSEYLFGPGYNLPYPDRPYGAQIIGSSCWMPIVASDAQANDNERNFGTSGSLSLSVRYGKNEIGHG